MDSQLSLHMEIWAGFIFDLETSKNLENQDLPKKNSKMDQKKAQNLENWQSDLENDLVTSKMIKYAQWWKIAFQNSNFQKKSPAASYFVNFVF